MLCVWWLKLWWPPKPLVLWLPREWLLRRELFAFSINQNLRRLLCWQLHQQLELVVVDESGSPNNDDVRANVLSNQARLLWTR